jgi:hypothetical protein
MPMLPPENRIKVPSLVDLADVAVLFLARHGEGYHNTAETFYGTSAWDCHWSLQSGNGTVTWVCFPELVCRADLSGPRRPSHTQRNRTSTRSQQRMESPTQCLHSITPEILFVPTLPRCVHPQFDMVGHHVLETNIYRRPPREYRPPHL